MNNDRQKLISAKMLLDTFEVPNRPVTLSAHQYKKKFGTNQGYADYKKKVKLEREEWDRYFKQLQKTSRTKSKHLAEVQLSDEAFKQAEEESLKKGLTIPEILGDWLEKGRKNS